MLINVQDEKNFSIPKFKRYNSWSLTIGLHELILFRICLEIFAFHCMIFWPLYIDHFICAQTWCVAVHECDWTALLMRQKWHDIVHEIKMDLSNGRLVTFFYEKYPFRSEPMRTLLWSEGTNIVENNIILWAYSSTFVYMENTFQCK